MAGPQGMFRRNFRISQLCPDFQAIVHCLDEEGMSLHYPHERPCQVILDDRGNLLPRTDRQVAVVFRVSRTTPLLPQMEQDLKGLVNKPVETIFLAMSAGDPVVQSHMILLQEFSRIALALAEAGTPVTVVAVSHRRMIHETLVIRHYPVALCDSTDGLIWVHPAAHGYGLIRPGFPAHQNVRVLGRRNTNSLGQELRRWDPETGLPIWYRQAKESLLEIGCCEEPGFAEILDHYARSLLQRSLAQDLEPAMRQATREFLTGFERHFGPGGLYLAPGVLEFG